MVGGVGSVGADGARSLSLVPLGFEDDLLLFFSIVAGVCGMRIFFCRGCS